MTPVVKRPVRRDAYRTGLRNIDDHRCLRTDTLQLHPIGRKRSVFEFDSQKDLYKAMLEDLSTAITDISAMGADEIAKLKSFDCWCNGDKAYG